MKKLSLLLLCGTLFTAALTFNACLKKGHDEPVDNTGYDPQLTVTHTIAQVLAMPLGIPISQDVIVSGIVVMDDRSGNYYKKFVIQDSTGGLEINLDQNNIYSDYPIGRKVYLKCKGLTMGSYGGMIQLGYGLDEKQSIIAIPFAMADNFIVKANYPNAIKVDTFTYDELSNASANSVHLNTLIAIKAIQFTENNAGVPYSAANTSTDRRIEGCSATTNNTEFVVRTSNYARFQATKTPAGSGVIVALYTRYVSGTKSTAQLVIRDTNDVQFGSQRCDGNSFQEPELVSVADLRDMYTGTARTLSGIKITGTVISDRIGANGQDKNMIIQQGAKGIVIRFISAHSYNPGDSVTVLLTGAKLEEYHGTLQAGSTPNANAGKVGTGTIVPKVLTLLDLNNSFESYESTLVKIIQASISPAGTYSGNKTLTDATGTITLYTSASAVFSGAPVPATPMNFTGIVCQYNNTRQLQLRNLNDVQ